MSEHSYENSVEKYLLTASNDLVDLLKAVSQTVRLQILILCMYRNKTFKELLDHLDVKKTTLNVHLNQLLDQKLLNKEVRGSYRTTGIGEDIIRVSSHILKEAHFKKLTEEQKYSLNGLSARDGKKMSETTLISDNIKYEPAWLSYLASITGVMKYYNLPVNLEDVAGYSGYSFLLNMAEAFTCPSGPTAHTFEVWDEIRNGTKDLGVTINHWTDSESFPETDYAISSRDQERSKILFEKVKSALDLKSQPVILWGLPIPEYGIVKGYKDQSYTVSTFRYLNRVPENPVKYDSLQAPGCLEMMTLDKNGLNPSKDSHYEALKRALKFAKGDYLPVKGYKTSTKAFDQWISHLESNDPKKYPYHGNSYLGVCTAEALQLSADFLVKIGKELKDENLESTGNFYLRGYETMSKFSKLFPFGFEGDLSSENRNQGIKYLQKTKNLVSDAIDTLQDSI